MKPNPSTPTNYVERYDAAKALLERDAPSSAVAAHLIRLTAPAQPLADSSRFAAQRLEVAELVRAAGAGNEHRKTAVLAAARSVLRASEEIAAEHQEILTSAAGRCLAAPKSLPPTAEEARAFLARFLPAATTAGQKGAHNDWYINLGPGSGRTFPVTPDPAAIEALAKEIAAGEGADVSDEHRLVAADQLAKQSTMKYEDQGAAGRLFGLPYDQLEKVGGLALAKANANNAASVRAASVGLLAHLSGVDVQIDQNLDAAGFQAALTDKIGSIDVLAARLETSDGPSWDNLSDTQREKTTAYFSGLLGEFAELRLGLRTYERLSAAASGALSTTHDVYVQMRAPDIFSDDWAKAQAVPLAQLDKSTKDADIPPILFALHGMVHSAEQSLRSSR